MTELVAAEESQAEVSAVVQIGNSDIVDMMVLAYKTKNSAKMQKIWNRHKKVTTRKNHLAETIHHRLVSRLLQLHGDVFQDFFKALNIFADRDIRVFPSMKSAHAALDERTATKEEIEERDYYCYDNASAVMRLAGVHKRHYPFGKTISWTGIPERFSIHPVFVEIDKQEEFRELRELSLHELFGREHRDIYADPKFFKVPILKSDHADINMIRRLSAQQMKLSEEIEITKSLAADDGKLRLKISARLTEKLLEEAGMSVEIEKVWASMAVSVEDALKLQVEKPKRSQNSYDDIDPDFDPNDFKDLDEED